MRLNFGGGESALLGDNWDICVSMGEGEHQRLDIRVLNLYPGLYVSVGFLDCFKSNLLIVFRHFNVCADKKKVFYNLFKFTYDNLSQHIQYFKTR